MDIGPEGEPVELPIPAHPDQRPVKLPPVPEPAEPGKVPA
jgi:hypothetical protein